MLKQLKESLTAKRVAAGAALATVGANAMATGAYDTITAAVSWSDVTTAIVTIFASIAGVYVVFKGGKKILSAIKGA